MSGWLQNSVWEKSKRLWTPRHSLSFCRKYQHLATKLSRWKWKDRARSFITRGCLVWGVLGLDPRPSIYYVPCCGCQKTFFIYISVICSASMRLVARKRVGSWALSMGRKSTEAIETCYRSALFLLTLNTGGIDGFGYAPFITFFFR